MPAIEIGKVWVSLDIIKLPFLCHLKKCKGLCCVKGDSGAPLEKEEIALLKKTFPIIKKYLGQRNQQAIFEQGLYEEDIDGDIVTPLIENKECAYAIFEKGIAMCAIEKAFIDQKTTFRKPISCYLYPIRVKKLGQYEGLNYEQSELCKSARNFGIKNNIPVFKFLKNALIQKYGKDWYSELEKTAEEIKKYKNSNF